ncbi:MAG: hypothetical protein MPN21_23310 [Thermoanaerobaculia bacterium]|nr:hypothetical protein [Thermoanaerobaculia bacterium]
MFPSRPRVALLLTASLILTLLLAGCVAKGEHEALQGELAQCEEQLAQSKAENISWQNRFDRESQRWEQVGASIEEAVPRALNELDEERERIIQAVPEQVQEEVSRYLDGYFNTVMRGFDALNEQNERTRIELETTNKVLASLGADTKQIGQAIDSSLTESKAKREQIASHLTDMIDHIVEYDQTRLNCKRCPERLKMRDRSREELLAFHAELMADLAELQTFASLAGSSPPAELGGEAGNESEADAATDETEADGEATEG